MPDASEMTPAEYAAFTGAMSYPTGRHEAQACQAVDADHVARFVRHLEDPDMRLVTESTPTCHMPMNEWTSWGVAGKAAILAVVREGMAAMRARAAVKSADSLVAEAESDKRICDAVVKAFNPHLGWCVEPGCGALATCHCGKHPYCQTHFDAIPF